MLAICEAVIEQEWLITKDKVARPNKPGSKTMKLGFTISLSLSLSEQNLFDDVHIVVDTSVRQSNRIIFINIVTKLVKVKTVYIFEELELACSFD